MYKLEDLLQSAKTTAIVINQRYVPCRPERPWGWWGLKYRTKAAWMVFTGKADAVIWPEGQ